MGGNQILLLGYHYQVAYWLLGRWCNDFHVVSRLAKSHMGMLICSRRAWYHTRPRWVAAPNKLNKRRTMFFFHWFRKFQRFQTNEECCKKEARKYREGARWHVDLFHSTNMLIFKGPWTDPNIRKRRRGGFPDLVSQFSREGYQRAKQEYTRSTIL